MSIRVVLPDGTTGRLTGPPVPSGNVLVQLDGTGLLQVVQAGDLTAAEPADPGDRARATTDDPDEACQSGLCDQGKTCDDCGGEGSDEYGFCPTCDGEGEIVPEHCCVCGGSPYCLCCRHCGGYAGNCDCYTTRRETAGPIVSRVVDADEW